MIVDEKEKVNMDDSLFLKDDNDEKSGESENFCEEEKVDEDSIDVSAFDYEVGKNEEDNEFLKNRPRIDYLDAENLIDRYEKNIPHAYLSVKEDNDDKKDMNYIKLKTLLYSEGFTLYHNEVSFWYHSFEVVIPVSLVEKKGLSIYGLKIWFETREIEVEALYCTFLAEDRKRYYVARVRKNSPYFDDESLNSSAEEKLLNIVLGKERKEGRKGWRIRRDVVIAAVFCFLGILFFAVPAVCMKVIDKGRRKEVSAYSKEFNMLPYEYELNEDFYGDTDEVMEKVR